MDDRKQNICWYCESWIMDDTHDTHGLYLVLYLNMHGRTQLPRTYSLLLNPAIHLPQKARYPSIRPWKIYIKPKNYFWLENNFLKFLKWNFFKLCPSQVPTVKSVASDTNSTMLWDWTLLTIFTQPNLSSSSIYSSSFSSSWFRSGSGTIHGFRTVSGAETQYWCTRGILQYYYSTTSYQTNQVYFLLIFWNCLIFQQAWVV